MKVTLLILLFAFMQQKHTLLFDFNTKESSGKWYAVNDEVMGGISKSEMNIKNGMATFSGNLSGDNNGGFASVRALTNNMNNSSYKGVLIRVKGDGKTYILRFRTNNDFDGYAYQTKIITKKDEWEEYSLDFENFQPTFRGRMLSNKPILESKNIAQIGIMIADKQFGQFKIDINWIKLY